MYSWMYSCSCSIFGCSFISPPKKPKLLLCFVPAFLEMFADVRVEMRTFLLSEPSQMLVLSSWVLSSWVLLGPAGSAGSAGAPSVRDLLRPQDGGAEPCPPPPSSRGSSGSCSADGLSCTFLPWTLCVGELGAERRHPTFLCFLLPVCVRVCAPVDYR